MSRINCCLLILLLPGWLYAQQNAPYAGELAKISIALKQLQNLRYSYVLTADYPNGEKDKLKGEIYIGNDQKYFCNDNEAFTLIYTDTWFYKADHNEKTIALVNLEKHLKKDYKRGLEKDLFAQSTVNLYLDSIVQKYAVVKNLKKSGDTINMELSFPARVPIKSIVLVYDEKAKILVSYTMRSFQAWHSDEFGKGKGTTEIITCKDFKKIQDDKLYRTDRFFTIRKNTVALKKYDKYTLTSKL